MAQLEMPVAKMSCGRRATEPGYASTIQDSYTSTKGLLYESHYIPE